VDLKINRCTRFLGNSAVTLVSEVGPNWKLSFQHYDDSCETPIGSPGSTADFEKNACTLDDGLYVTLNIIAHPLKSIPSGGGAFVYYENHYDCQISKHTNLARAVLMLTWQLGNCGDALVDYVKPIACDSTSLVFEHYSDNICDPLNSLGMSTHPTDPAVLDCPNDVLFQYPYQVLCIAASAGGNDGANGTR
jgi:hypothetical protein